MGDSHTGVAHLAVLITPVGVVHIVAHKVIHLLGGSILCAPLSRRCHSHKRNPVLVVDLLLSSEIICERTVVNTFHPVISTKTGRNVGSKRPAVVEFAGSIVGHKAETVESRVGEYAESPARTYRCRICKYVGDTVISSEGIIRRFHAYGVLLCAGGLVETAPEREW